MKIGGNITDPPIELSRTPKPVFNRRKQSSSSAQGHLPKGHILQTKTSGNQIQTLQIEGGSRKTLKKSRTNPDLHKNIDLKQLQNTFLETKKDAPDSYIKVDLDTSFANNNNQTFMGEYNSATSSEFERLPSPSSEKSYIPPKPSDTTNQIIKLNKMIDHANKKNTKEKEGNLNQATQNFIEYPQPKTHIFNAINESRNQNNFNMNPYNMYGNHSITNQFRNISDFSRKDLNIFNRPCSKLDQSFSQNIGFMNNSFNMYDTSHKNIFSKVNSKIY
jgi:hypothetical protein